MKIDDMRLLYDYNYWATERLLVASARVGGGRFTAQSSHSHGGLRGTLVHILEAECGWRMRIQHNAAGPELSEEQFPTFDVLLRRWRDEEAAMRDFLASLTDDDLARVLHYRTDSGETRERVVWHLLLHVVNHGTQHRSEAAALLTSYGHSPGDVDFTHFLSERPSAAA